MQPDRKPGAPVAAQAARAARQAQAVALALEGASLVEIAGETGTSIATASRDVRDALAALAEGQPETVELRAKTLERLERLFAETWRAFKANPTARGSGAVVRVLQEIRRMGGLAVQAPAFDPRSVPPVTVQIVGGSGDVIGTLPSAGEGAPPMLPPHLEARVVRTPATIEDGDV